MGSTASLVCNVLTRRAAFDIHIRKACHDETITDVVSRPGLLTCDGGAISFTHGCCVSRAGVFEAYFGKRWRATPLGMSGDTVAYLRWRLEHGELPRARPPRVAVLLVGTNDLRDAKALYEHEAGDGATVEGRAAAVLASARDIGARCGLHAYFYIMHSAGGCKRLKHP